GRGPDCGQGAVLADERTHAGPKQDRLCLLEATGADTGLLFMLVADASGALLRASTPAGEPVAEARDLRGERHRLWRVTDASVITGVQAALAAPRGIIDGCHHRYV